MTTKLRLAAAFALVAGVLLAFAPIIEANTAQPPFHMGRVWTSPEFDGCGGWGNSSIAVPGGIINPDKWPDDNSIKRGWIGHGRKYGNYLISTNWTDPDGVENPVATSYVHRSYNYDAYDVPNWIPGSGGADGVNLNYVYAVGIELTMRNARPNIYVNGEVIDFSNGPYDPDAEYKIRTDSGTFPYPPPVVVSDHVVEYSIKSTWRYIQGVEVNRTQYAYPYGSAHQDYFINDFVLTNNGISGAFGPDDPRSADDPAPILEGQTITNMIFVWAYGYNAEDVEAINYWDNYASWTDPWGSGNYAFYWYDGNAKELVPDVAPYNGPDWGDFRPDTKFEGHPANQGHIMFGTLFASEAGDVTAPITGQPAFRLIVAERGLDYAGKAYSPTTAEEMWEFVASGDFQMEDDVDIRDDDYTAQWVNPTTGDGNRPTMCAGYGPLGAELDFDNMDQQGWTLQFGESARVVQVAAGGSIDRNAAQDIGAHWVEQANADADPATWYRDGDLELLASAEDTVRKAVNMAYWNFFGEFAPVVDAASLEKWQVPSYAANKPAGRGEWDVPEAPRAPANVAYRARSEAEGGGIEIRWSSESMAEPDFDTGLWDFSHYKIIRQAGSRLAPWVTIADNITPGMLATAAAVDDAPFEGFIWLDKDVVAGTDYWYAVVAVDDGSQNWAEPGVALESTVWWTWSGYTDQGVTATQVGTAVSGQPAKFALNQNAPNPFNPETSISFSLPETGQASLVIYGPTGQVVRTLVNSTVESGQHSVTWDGLDSFGRPVASGVYIYRLVAGDQVAHKRMVLVR